MDALSPLLPYLAVVPPAWVLAFVLAALNVLIFRIVLGRDGRAVLYYLPFGIFGFALGNLAAVFASSPLPTLGDVHVIEASLGAWAAQTLANARGAG